MEYIPYDADLCYQFVPVVQYERPSLAVSLPRSLPEILESQCPGKFSVQRHSLWKVSPFTCHIYVTYDMYGKRNTEDK